MLWVISWKLVGVFHPHSLQRCSFCNLHLQLSGALRRQVLKKVQLNPFTAMIYSRIFSAPLCTNTFEFHIRLRLLLYVFHSPRAFYKHLIYRTRRFLTPKTSLHNSQSTYTTELKFKPLLQSDLPVEYYS